MPHANNTTHATASNTHNTRPAMGYDAIARCSRTKPGTIAN